ncbi:hypothetical protein B0T17DRAFT_511722 [Bombardia bombarda]|uniref:Uncharacterized protein n=1 Tax=Bombardia bombarda TaxID=252184 RepID=A0AA39U780_9PEZI|nr:hypothetical protein B0T17DRAFT_511722 [Bombardia bombarda]
MNEDALLEAEYLGKTPALCDSRSPFMSYYTACMKCTYVNSEPNSTEPVSYVSYVGVGSFDQFIEWCESLAPESASSSQVTTELKTVWIVATLSNGNLASQLYTVTMTIPVVSESRKTSGTASNPSSSQSTSLAVSTISSVQNSVSTDSTVSAPSASAGPRTGQEFHDVHLLLTKFLTIDNSLLYRRLNLIPRIQHCPDSLAYWIRRRKRSAARMDEFPPRLHENQFEKAQLHGDSLVPRKPPGEVEGSLPRRELEGQVLEYHELEGSLPPRAELETETLQAAVSNESAKTEGSGGANDNSRTTTIPDGHSK